MFEPGDKVIVKGDEQNKVWTVTRYPYKMWHDQIVPVGDDEGNERAFPSEILQKTEELAGGVGGGCGPDFCEFRDEMRL